MYKKASFVILILCLLFGCKSPVSTEKPKPKNVLSGNWSGTLTISALNQSGTINFTLSQSGESFSGSFTTSTNRFGSISGTQLRQSISANLIFEDNCRGTAAISATLSDDKRSVVGQGTVYNDCIGSYNFAFTVYKK